MDLVDVIQAVYDFYQSDNNGKIGIMDKNLINEAKKHIDGLPEHLQEFIQEADKIRKEDVRRRVTANKEFARQNKELADSQKESENLLLEFEKKKNEAEQARLEAEEKAVELEEEKKKADLLAIELEESKLNTERKLIDTVNKNASLQKAKSQSEIAKYAGSALFRLSRSFMWIFVVYLFVSFWLRLEGKLNSNESELVAGLGGLMFAAVERILIFVAGYFGGSMNIFSGAKKVSGSEGATGTSMEV